MRSQSYQQAQPAQESRQRNVPHRYCASALCPPAHESTLCRGIILLRHPPLEALPPWRPNFLWTLPPAPQNHWPMSPATQETRRAPVVLSCGSPYGTRKAALRMRDCTSFERRKNICFPGSSARLDLPWKVPAPWLCPLLSLVKIGKRF